MTQELVDEMVEKVKERLVSDPNYIEWGEQPYAYNGGVPPSGEQLEADATYIVEKAWAQSLGPGGVEGPLTPQQLQSIISKLEETQTAPGWRGVAPSATNGENGTAPSAENGQNGTSPNSENGGSGSSNNGGNSTSAPNNSGDTNAQEPTPGTPPGEPAAPGTSGPGATTGPPPPTPLFEIPSASKLAKSMGAGAAMGAALGAASTYVLCLADGNSNTDCLLAAGYAGLSGAAKGLFWGAVVSLGPGGEGAAALYGGVQGAQALTELGSEIGGRYTAEKGAQTAETNQQNQATLNVNSPNYANRVAAIEQEVTDFENSQASAKNACDDVYILNAKARAEGLDAAGLSQEISSRLKASAKPAACKDAQSIVDAIRADAADLTRKARALSDAVKSASASAPCPPSPGPSSNLLKLVVDVREAQAKLDRDVQRLTALQTAPAPATSAGDLIDRLAALASDAQADADMVRYKLAQAMKDIGDLTLRKLAILRDINAFAYAVGVGVGNNINANNSELDSMITAWKSRVLAAASGCDNADKLQDLVAAARNAARSAAEALAEARSAANVKPANACVPSDLDKLRRSASADALAALAAYEASRQPKVQPVSCPPAQQTSPPSPPPNSASNTPSSPSNTPGQCDSGTYWECVDTSGYADNERYGGCWDDNEISDYTNPFETCAPAAGGQQTSLANNCPPNTYSFQCVVSDTKELVASGCLDEYSESTSTLAILQDPDTTCTHGPVVSAHASPASSPPATPKPPTHLTASAPSSTETHPKAAEATPPLHPTPLPTAPSAPSSTETHPKEAEATPPPQVTHHSTASAPASTESHPKVAEATPPPKPTPAPAEPPKPKPAAAPPKPAPKRCSGSGAHWTKQHPFATETITVGSGGRCSSGSVTFDTSTFVGYEVKSQPAHGKVISTGKAWSYRPDPDFKGSDSFTILVRSTTHTVTLTYNVTVQ